METDPNQIEGKLEMSNLSMKELQAVVDDPDEEESKNRRKYTEGSF